MKYDHRYHAGNFCDIFKQMILLKMGLYLQRKDSPLCLIDLHGGFGKYPLTELTAEAESGIHQMIGLESTVFSEDFQLYLNYVQPLLSQGIFPGSPLFLSLLLRNQDRLWVCEKHDEPYESLKNCFQHESRVFIRQGDAYATAKSLLPPSERRALICIDPPYERPEEYDELNMALKEIFAERFLSGSYLIWYPIGKRAHQLGAIQQTCTRLWGAEKVLHLQAEWSTGLDSQMLTQCGLTILNPPYLLKDWVNQSQKDWENIGLSVRVLLR